jgi:hypothetical protein
LGIRPLLNDLATVLGPECLILAYLDDIYILSLDANIFEKVHAFFDDRQPSIQLNMAKSKTTSLEDVRERGLELLGSCIGPTAVREKFLEAKIEQEEATLHKLNDLPYQHALLVLRSCLQMNLRHLQRSLPSDDLTHQWQRLDRSLADSVRRIRGNVSPDTPADTLIHLPIKLGGLGILSFEHCTPHASAAANEASDIILAPLLQPETSVDPTTIKSQRERCQETFLTARDALLANLDQQQVKLVIEASSYIGRKWLSVIPFNQALRLTDFEVSAALHIRTLCPSSLSHCRHCGSTNPLGHDEVCTQRWSWAVGRHELVKKAIGQALSSLEGMTVHLEPAAEGGRRRNDIQAIGSRPTGLASQEFDVTITSLMSQHANISTNSISTRSGAQLDTVDDGSMDASAAKVSSLLIHRHLDSVAHRKGSHRPDSMIPFCPLVFSSGGMMEKGTAEALKRWKELMNEGVYSFLVRRLSVCLLRGRVRSFEL